MCGPPGAATWKRSSGKWLQVADAPPPAGQHRNHRAFLDWVAVMDVRVRRPLQLSSATKSDENEAKMKRKWMVTEERE